MATISKILVFFQVGIQFSSVGAECLDSVCPLFFEDPDIFRVIKEDGLDEPAKIPVSFLCFSLLASCFIHFYHFPPTRTLFVLGSMFVMNAYYNVIQITVTKLVILAIIWLV